MLIGVKDNGRIAGVSSDEEIYMVEQAAQMYCRPPQTLDFNLHRIEGKTILVATIRESDVKPVKAPDEQGEWRTYYRVADENIAVSDIHEQVIERKSSAHSSTTLAFSESEHCLLEYLQNQGAITAEGYMRLCHISRLAAEMSLVNLCEMGVLKISYHDSSCVFSLT